MNYLRGAIADVKQKYRTNKVVTEATTAPTPANYATCVVLADGHANLVLSALRDRLTYTHPEVSLGSMTLLEHLVGSCNYAFHESLAQHSTIQEKIIQLAIRRAEDDAHRRVQRLCRLTLLEYSRMFADDKALHQLSTMSATFEKRTHKNLMRCLNVQTKRVAFTDVRPQDVVALTPLDGPKASVSAGVKDLAPLRFCQAEVWLCRVCGYMNAPAAHRCAACETARATGATPPASPRESPAPGGSRDSACSSPSVGSPAPEKHEEIRRVKDAEEALSGHGSPVVTGSPPHTPYPRASGATFAAVSPSPSSSPLASPDSGHRADDEELLAGRGNTIGGSSPPLRSEESTQSARAFAPTQEMLQTHADASGSM